MNSPYWLTGWLKTFVFTGHFNAKNACMPVRNAAAHPLVPGINWEQENFFLGLRILLAVEQEENRHMHRIARLSLLVLAAGIVGCATLETLEPKSPVTPEGLDLSGQWKLNAEEGQDQAAVLAAIRASSKDRSFVRVSRSQSRISANTNSQLIILGPKTGAIVHAFLQTAEKLKISQTRHSLFISFSGSIVEEYTFGENREIKLGAVTAARVSGWEGSSYVIETLDRDGRKLTEGYSLNNAADKLYREIILRDKNGDESAVAQVFDRVER